MTSSNMPSDVDPLGRVVILFAAHAEAVELAAVKDDEIAPQPCRLDELMSAALPMAWVLPQLRRFDEDAEEVPDMGRAAHGHAELTTDHAVPAAAVDRIGAMMLRRSSRARSCTVCDHMIVGLGELREAPAIAQINALKACSRGRAGSGRAQIWLQALRPLRAGGGLSAAAVVRAIDAGDLEACERRAIERGVREVLRRRGVATASATPQRRMNSIERALMAVARGWSAGPSPCSITRHGAPRQPRSPRAQARPGRRRRSSTGVSIVGEWC